jgi:uncharacterized membrane protein
VLCVGAPQRTGAATASTMFVGERLVGLGIASALCVALELLREWRYGADTYRFLVWNLALAWIPLLFALLIYLCFRRGGSALEFAPIAALWLLFLPNAPYIVTDFIHLEPTPGAPLWLDGAILGVFAGTGMVLGFVSVYLVHAVVRQRHGVLAGWCSVMIVLGFASTGVFLGRFMRWNSWDVLVRPGERLAEFVQRLSEPSALARAAGMTLVLTFLLTAAYSCFYMLLRFRVEPRRLSNRKHVPPRF